MLLIRPPRCPGFPEGFFEARDWDGLPVFFDGNGERLYRSGVRATSPTFQLRGMTPPLARTGLMFPGGMFLRRHRRLTGEGRGDLGAEVETAEALTLHEGANLP